MIGIFKTSAEPLACDYSTLLGGSRVRYTSPIAWESHEVPKCELYRGTPIALIPFVFTACLPRSHRKEGWRHGATDDVLTPLIRHVAYPVNVWSFLAKLHLINRL